MAGETETAIVNAPTPVTRPAVPASTPLEGTVPLQPGQPTTETAQPPTTEQQGASLVGIETGTPLTAEDQQEIKETIPPDLEGTGISSEILANLSGTGAIALIEAQKRRITHDPNLAPERKMNILRKLDKMIAQAEDHTKNIDFDASLERAKKLEDPAKKAFAYDVDRHIHRFNLEQASREVEQWEAVLSKDKNNKEAQQERARAMRKKQKIDDALTKLNEERAGIRSNNKTPEHPEGEPIGDQVEALAFALAGDIDQNAEDEETRIANRERAANIHEKPLQAIFDIFGSAAVDKKKNDQLLADLTKPRDPNNPNSALMQRDAAARYCHDILVKSPRIQIEGGQVILGAFAFLQWLEQKLKQLEQQSGGH